MPQNLTNLFQFFVSHLPGNLFAFLGVSAVFLGFWAIGRLFLGRENTGSALLGWAFIYLVSLLGAVAGFPDLRYIIWLFLVLIVCSLLIRRQDLLPDGSIYTLLLLLLPIAAVALFMPLLHWDSYWHWALNGSYLYRFDRFPADPLEGFPSFHPTYPMATSLVYYFSSEVTGRFAESTGIFMNIALSLVALDSVVKLLRDVVPGDTDTGKSALLFRYGIPLAAFVIVLSLNPSYRAVNYFSANADPALGVIVMVVIIRWCSLIASGKPEDRLKEVSPWKALSDGDFKKGLLLLFMLGVLLAGVKHSGWVLALVLSMAGVIAGIVHRTSWVRWLSPAVAVLSGAFLATVLWKAYVSSHLATEDQFSIRPVAEWRFDLVRGLLAGALIDIKARSFYYAIVLFTVIAGLVSLVRASAFKNEKLSLMLGFVALAMPIHFLSLFVAYLGTGFNQMEILKAASLHRYSTHVGFATCVFGLVALICLALPYAGNLLSRVTRAQAIALGAGLYAIPACFNILLPGLYAGSSYLKSYQGLRDSAAMVSRVIPAAESVAIIGSEWAMNFASYELWRPAEARRGPLFKGRKISQTDADLSSAMEHLDRWMSDQSIDHIWLFDDKPLNAALGHAQALNVVWSRATGQWRVIE